MRLPLPFALVFGSVLMLAPERASAENPPDPPAHPCIGHWVGVGKNTGHSEPWTIDMVVSSSAGERCGTIEYPSLRCGGYLERCEDKGNGRVVIKEHYTHNPGTCAPAGKLDVVCEGDTMQWLWLGWENVRTTLRRVRPDDAGAPTASGAPVPSGGAPATSGNAPAIPPAPQALPGSTPAPPPPSPQSNEPQSGGCLCSIHAKERATRPALGLLVVAVAMTAWRRRGARGRAAASRHA